MDNVKPEELLDESRFKDFIKPFVFGTSLCLSPLAQAHDNNLHELEVAELTNDLVSQYNFLQKNPVLDIAGAQKLADEAFTQVCNEVQNGDEVAENTKAWYSANATYKYLIHLDYKIATAFVAKFNHAARKLFGVQIRALPNPKA